MVTPGTRQFQVGVDIGGTFTDVAVVDDTGRVFSDKAESTRPDLVPGVISALEAVCMRIGLPVRAVLESTTRFVNGTTEVTNAIAEVSGAKVGLIATQGFADVLRIGRGGRAGHRDQLQERNVAQIVPRDLIAEVPERIDRDGEIVVSLDPAAARLAVGRLAGQGVEAIAVCLLWGFANPVHEEIVARIAETEYPEIHLSVASRLFPVAREYERTMTTVLNSFTGMRLASYIERIEAELSRRGLRVPVSFMQGFGGTLSAAEARLRPITLVDSGPAGGVIAAQRLARRIGLDNVLGADMGGTSFDVSVLSNGEIKVADRVTLGGQFLTCVSKIDVHPIGAGGGSIAWIDARGVPQIGPRSAGSAPGPACYGHGGTEPTVTDAVVTLGIIDPSYFLGGRRSLDVAAARSAIDSVVARPLGLSIEDAASALYRLVVANMSSAVRAVTIERGRDPRQFSLCGFGGALGIFAADIAQTLGISRVVLPGYGAVFSAYGLLTSQDMRVRSRSVYWDGGDPAPVWDALTELEGDARRSLAASGFGEESVTVKWEGNFVFQGQYWEMSVPLVRASRLADFDLAKVQDGFADHYEAEFGAGTAWQNASVVLLGVRVVAAGHADIFEAQAAEVPGQAATAPGLIGRRQMVLADHAGPVAVDVYDGTTLAPGHRIDGPGVVEHELTTHLVPRGWSLRVDGLGDYLLEDHQRPAVTEVVAP